MKAIVVTFRLLSVIMLLTSTLWADGVMRPANQSYPGDFLRLRTTRVDVTITGQVAQTVVEQEFVNEWSTNTDAVYSFPLAYDARAYDFLFWYNDTLYRAALKEMQQVTNPGTGEGAIDALLNKYLGTNALRVYLQNIPAGGVQRIRLHYISLCRYQDGKVEYRYPLGTDQFVTYPVETVSFRVHVTSTTPISSVDVDGYSDARVVTLDSRRREISLDRSKLYPLTDFSVSYQTSVDSLGLDFYSVAHDSIDGHFALFLKPRVTSDTTSVLAQNVLFVLDRSSSTYGVQLDRSKDAIRECINRLRPTDRFNIMVFNTATQFWSSNAVSPTSANIVSAGTFLNLITATGGSTLKSAIIAGLSKFTNDSLIHSIMLFTDGRSVADPRDIRTRNTGRVGIFPVGIGDNVWRQQLEMLAYMNYGIPTFIALTDPVVQEVLNTFSQINYPVMKDTRMEIGTNAYSLLPQIPATVYRGSRFFLAGRFHTPGSGTLSLGGTNITGSVVYDFPLTFSADKVTYKFTEVLWAKEKIDDLEREISVYGETDSLKQLLIKTSLSYNIRCKYTAYLADRSLPVSSVPTVRPSITCSVGLAQERLAHLRWTIANPADVAEVHIQRSDRFDGVFITITSPSPLDSEYVDQNPVSAQMFYRIVVVTRSGEHIYSEVISPSALPVSTTLYQNYPNPFNPDTHITFAVPGTRPVNARLTVYDLLGRVVKTLVAQTVQPGTHQITWDGKDEEGLPVAAGTYVFRLMAEERSLTRKMVLLR